MTFLGYFFKYHLSLQCWTGDVHSARALEVSFFPEERFLVLGGWVSRSAGSPTMTPAPPSPRRCFNLHFGGGGGGGLPPWTPSPLRSRN